jgi:hypothetical protein
VQTISLLDDDVWDWGDARHEREQFAGRECAHLTGEPALVCANGVELLDGVLELDLAVTADRNFQGLSWRIQESDENCEAFWVRPHQMGNPDAIQYSPVTNGLTAWQLYTGEGFWHPARFPFDDWFTLRVAFAGERLQVAIDGDIVLPCTRQRRAPVSGRAGIRFAGGDLRVSELRYTDATPSLPLLPDEPRVAGGIERWEISAPFAEAGLDAQLAVAQSWTAVEAEPSGLVNLGAVHGIEDGRNTVFARAPINAGREQRPALELGFSDRAVVYLNGERLFRGDDGYRTRDYRFLGSIGWFDTVYLPLDEGENELLIAVSEDFGGWGVQARLAD